MKLRSIFAVSALFASTAAPSVAAPLSDVSPTDWAYQAIQTLDNRYGCLAGYPDGTFRGQRAATRNEIVALTNACLDRITEFQSAEDAKLASALRATTSRVDSIEKTLATKANGVGNYVGLGVLLNRQGVEGNGYSEYRTVSGATVQGRYVATKALGGEISLRPYLNAVGTPSGEIGAGGGAMVSYDRSIAQRGGVSSANVYLGAGYQIPFVNNTDANYQSAVGEKGQAVFAVGLEGRLTNSLVGFADVKLPTTKSGITEDGDSLYSPVFTTGVGIKF